MLSLLKYRLGLLNSFFFFIENIWMKSMCQVYLENKNCANSANYCIKISSFFSHLLIVHFILFINIYKLEEHTSQIFYWYDNHIMSRVFTIWSSGQKLPHGIMDAKCIYWKKKNWLNKGHLWNSTNTYSTRSLSFFSWNIVYW